MYKILILLLYFERYKMVRNALMSIKKQSYKNWELVFIDDGSIAQGEPIVREILKDELEKIRFYNSFDSIDQKKKRGGSRVGSIMNIAIKESNANLGIILCDDDALKEDYLEKLFLIFKKKPELNYGYSHVIPFDPTKENYYNIKNERNCSLNRRDRVIPQAILDASQVVWRLECNKIGNIWFDEVRTKNLDEDFFRKLCKRYGECEFLEIVGQYKGFFVDQLIKRHGENTYIVTDF